MSFKLICGGLVSKLSQLSLTHVNNFHTTAIAAGKINRMKDRKSMLKTVLKKSDGVQSSSTADIDSIATSQTFQRFPDVNLPDRMYGDTPFKELPIAHIRVSKNNTIISVTSKDGKVRCINSAGKEGYKNCRKGTNIAGQATAISLSKMALKLGIHTVRVTIKGLGPSRASAVKGLQMGGLNIISLTDDTPISEKPPRPRKARRV
ncbi:28S ribosomal protein S11, mitochondrial [Contarinia nasturtii]|uniref:28S ribosomal protein S11, mitochondrial n=1 Tax=Contarinia nasturtii TaxID=265458 RepID=UPI0012D398B1|nr:28S ribosomal protein S11, mitochondrial [Contarinia nasturtii]